jgi:benzoyl-CoA reductase/2-hydroxyglutaryl-CoA dehydratase subunit BcrC/BadD/HgdB
MPKDVYEAFLRLAGFEEDEMGKFLPEWRKASAKIHLSEDDIKFATEQWIPAYFDIKLEGIRKSIGSVIKEIIDLTKANEYKTQGIKIVYGIMPASLHYYYALKQTAPDKVYVTFPDASLAFGLNMLFHKLNPFLEEAERNGISYGCRHCALNKTRYAARRFGVIPSPDISWIWGFVCDEAPKTDEFIRLYHDPQWKTYITRIPHDQPLGTVEDEVGWRVEYLAAQMKDGFEAVQKALGIQVREEKITEVRLSWRRYAGKLEELNKLVMADPQPIGGVSIRLLGQPLGLPFNTGRESMEDALDITLREVKGRVNKKEGILPAGAPKLMAWMVPANIPWVAKMFEENGVGYQSYMFSKKQLAPPTYQDPYLATAESWLRMGTGASSNPGYEAAQLCEKLEEYGADGVVFGFWDFDRWLGSSHRLLAKLVEEKTKLPVFYIEGDGWEDRDYSPEALRTRIESICEIVKMRKGQ